MSFRVGDRVRIILPGPPTMEVPGQVSEVMPYTDSYVVRRLDTGWYYYFPRRDLLPDTPTPTPAVIPAIHASASSSAPASGFAGFCNACGGLRQHRLGCPNLGARTKH